MGRDGAPSLWALASVRVAPCGDWCCSALNTCLAFGEAPITPSPILGSSCSLPCRTSVETVGCIYVATPARLGCCLAGVTGVEFDACCWERCPPLNFATKAPTDSTVKPLVSVESIEVSGQKLPAALLFAACCLPACFTELAPLWLCCHAKPAEG